MAASILTELFESTQQRKRPEDVAQMIVDLTCSRGQVAGLARAGTRSHRRRSGPCKDLAVPLVPVEFVVERYEHGFALPQQQS